MAFSPFSSSSSNLEVARHHNGVSSCRHRVRGFGRGRASSSGRYARPRRFFRLLTQRSCLHCLLLVRTLVCGHGWDSLVGRPLAPVRRGSRGVRGDIFARVRPFDNTTIHAKEVARFTARGEAWAGRGSRRSASNLRSGGGEVSAKRVRTERPRGSGVRRTGVRRAERGAGAEGQARRARARAACVDGRESVVGEGDRGRPVDGTGRARVSSRLERGGGLLTEQHQARRRRRPGFTSTRRRRVRSIAASHFASMLSSGDESPWRAGQVTNPVGDECKSCWDAQS